MKKFASISRVATGFTGGPRFRMPHSILYVLFAVVAGHMALDACPVLQSDKSRGNNALTNSIGMKLQQIPAGTFLMGSLPGDPGAEEDEMPQHRVRITRPFYCGVYEVTQGEFQSVMGRNTSFFTNQGAFRETLKDEDTSRFPVDGVTWYDAWEFCRRLTELPEEKAAGACTDFPRRPSGNMRVGQEPERCLHMVMNFPLTRRTSMVIIRLVRFPRDGSTIVPLR